MTITLKASTSKGKRILQSYEWLSGRCKNDVYRNISADFSKAFDYLYSIYENDEIDKNGSDFRCSYHAGSWSWSCGWKFELDGEKCVRYETRENTYIILLNK